MPMARRLLIVTGAAALLWAGCLSSAQPKREARLRVLAEPSTTTVYIEDRYIGSARVLAANPKRLKPGVAYLTFQAPNYFPHDVRVELPPGETTIKMKLRPIPP